MNNAIIRLGLVYSPKIPVLRAEGRRQDQVDFIIHDSLLWN